MSEADVKTNGQNAQKKNISDNKAVPVKDGKAGGQNAQNKAAVVQGKKAVPEHDVKKAYLLTDDNPFKDYDSYTSVKLDTHLLKLRGLMFDSVGVGRKNSPISETDVFRYSLHFFRRAQAICTLNLSAGSFDPKSYANSVTAYYRHVCNVLRSLGEFGGDPVDILETSLANFLSRVMGAINYHEVDNLLSYCVVYFEGQLEQARFLSRSREKELDVEDEFFDSRYGIF